MDVVKIANQALEMVTDPFMNYKKPKPERRPEPEPQPVAQYRYIKYRYPSSSRNAPRITPRMPRLR